MVLRARLTACLRLAIGKAVNPDRFDGVGAGRDFLRRVAFSDAAWACERALTSTEE